MLVHCVIYIVAGAFAIVAASPITNPLRTDEDIGLVIPEHFDSKRTKMYHTYAPNSSIVAQEVNFDLNRGIVTEFSLRWSTTVGSPVFSSPVLFPSGPNGNKQIFVSTYYQYVEMIECDGYKSWGWPLSFEDSSFQGSPMVYDVDGDGNVDIGVVDKNGNMFWVRIGESGEYLEDYHVQVPKLRVKRDWAAGLDPAFVDSYVQLSMFDRSHQHQEGAGGAGRGGAMRTARLDDLQAAVPASSRGGGAGSRRRLSDGGDGQEAQVEEGEGEGEVVSNSDVPDFGDATDDFVRLEAERMQGHQQMYGMPQEGEDGPASLEDVLQPPAERADPLLDGAEAAGMDGTYEYAYRAAPFRARGGHRTGYGAGAYYGGMAGLNESDYVMVDAHILASPVLTDVNGDGHMEVLLSISYYFDQAEYAGTDPGFDPAGYVAGGVGCWDLDEQRWTWLVHLDLTTSQSKYQAMIYAAPTVADLDGDGRTEVVVGTAMGLLYVLDGESGFVRRFFPMQFNSIQAQVSVADVAGDGKLEMIVLDQGGTVAVVDLEGDVLWDARLSGTLPFPATVGDVDGDGVVDVVVVAATENKGSHIYALRGDTGAILPGYPFSLPGSAAVSSPVLLVDLLSSQRQKPRRRTGRALNDTLSGLSAARASGASVPGMHKPTLFAGTVDDPFPDLLLNLENAADVLTESSFANTRKGLHLVVSSHEGSVFLIYGQPTEQLVPAGNGASAFKSGSLAAMVKKTVAAKKGEGAGLRFHAQRLDVGEHIYSVPLLDDITGDGFLDLLVGTLNGQVLLFESSIPHHRSNSWTAFPNHRLNSVTHGVQGILVPQEEKDRLRQLDTKGSSTITIAFEIWDKRNTAKGEADSGFEYTVTVTRGPNRLNPIWTQKYDRPGRYFATVPVSPPEMSLMVISMKSDHGEYFEDAVHVALSTRFYVWIKYLLCGPMILLCFTLVSRFRKQIF